MKVSSKPSGSPIGIGTARTLDRSFVLAKWIFLIFSRMRPLFSTVDVACERSYRWSHFCRCGSTDRLSAELVRMSYVFVFFVNLRGSTLDALNICSFFIHYKRVTLFARSDYFWWDTFPSPRILPLRDSLGLERRSQKELGASLRVLFSRLLWVNVCWMNVALSRALGAEWIPVQNLARKNKVSG